MSVSRLHDRQAPLASIRWLPWVLLVLALGAFSFQSLAAEQRHQGTLIDDAYISLRYAANLADGRGPVWQAGDRVEGYTNFFEVVILAAWMRLGFDGELAAKVLGLTAGALALGLLVQAARQLQTAERRPLAGWGALMVASVPAYAVWAGAGLETTLFVFFILLAFVVTGAVWDQPDRLGRSFLLGLILTAVTLTRPDGVILVVAVLGVGWLRVATKDRGRRRPDFQSLALSTGVFIAAYGAYFLWRAGYYGQWLPNTFYVKVGGGLAQWQRGGRYVVEMAPKLRLLPIGGLALFGLALGVSEAAGRRPPAGSREPVPAWPAYAGISRVALAGLISIFGLLYSGYLIYIGGDAFGPRLALPVLVSVALLADAGLTGALWQLMRLNRFQPVATSLALASSLAVLLATFRPWQKEDAPPDVPQLRWNEFGRWLGAHANRDDTIAIDAAGAIPYFSGLHSIDMLGLNDRHIAHLAVANLGAGSPGHEKYDPGYVYAQEPQWLATWIDAAGRPAYLGLNRWPELTHYQPYVVLEMLSLTQPGMQFVGPDYDFRAGWLAGYQYLIWRRLDTAPAEDHFEIPLGDSASVQLGGTWQWKLHDVGGIDYLYTDQPGADLAFTVPAGGLLALTAVCHDWSGQLNVRIGQNEQITDLFARQIDPQCVTRYPVPGPAGALVNVRISVQAAHNAASHGAQLFLNRLLYFPDQLP